MSFHSLHSADGKTSRSERDRNLDTMFDRQSYGVDVASFMGLCGRHGISLADLLSSPALCPTRLIPSFLVNHLGCPLQGRIHSSTCLDLSMGDGC
jgi:hypothetical protein